MCDNLLMKIFNVIVFAVAAYYTFTGGMMMAMYWMAAGMLIDAVVDLIYHFLPKHKKC